VGQKNGLLNVNAKISCYFQRNVVTVKLRKEYLITLTYDTPVTLDKKLNSLMYRTLFCVNIYRSYKLLETVRFLAHPVRMTTLHEC